MSERASNKKLDDVHTESCPKCRNVMHQFAGMMTKCSRCLHEWYMGNSSRPKVPDTHHAAILANGELATQNWQLRQERDRLRAALEGALCGNCRGTGVIPDALVNSATCPRCRGSGYAIFSVETGEIP